MDREREWWWDEGSGMDVKCVVKSEASGMCSILDSLCGPLRGGRDDELIDDG
jgi:hypothetical protein